MTAPRPTLVCFWAATEADSRSQIALYCLAIHPLERTDHNARSRSKASAFPSAPTGSQEASEATEGDGRHLVELYSQSLEGTSNENGWSRRNVSPKELAKAWSVVGLVRLHISAEDQGPEWAVQTEL